MSKRPNIVSAHEKAVEEEIQTAREQRDRQMQASKGKKPSGEKAEPFIRSVSRGPAGHDVPPEVSAWIAEEDRVQMEHYQRIYDETEEIAPLREKWTEEFFERITGPRGFSVHAGTRRTIAKEDIPARPDRPFRVVW